MSDEKEKEIKVVTINKYFTPEGDEITPTQEELIRGTIKALGVDTKATDEETHHICRFTFVDKSPEAHYNMSGQKMSLSKAQLKTKKIFVDKWGRKIVLSGEALKKRQAQEEGCIKQGKKDVAKKAYIDFKKCSTVNYDGRDFAISERLRGEMYQRLAVKRGMSIKDAAGESVTLSPAQVAGLCNLLSDRLEEEHSKYEKAQK
jgi:hypothetical protein